MTSLPEPEWQRPLRNKPAGRAEFGYVDAQGLHDSSLEELRALLASGRLRHRPLVWTPDSPQVTTAAESPLLREAFQSGLRLRATHWKPRTVPLVLIVLGTFAIAFFTLSPASISDGDASRYAMVGALLLLSGLAGELIPRYQDFADSKRDPEELAANESADARHESWLAQHATGDTAVLVAGLMVVFLFQLPWRKTSVEAAGFIASAVRDGQWWRLFSSPLLHGNYLHIMANAGAITYAGQRIEAHLHRTFVPLVFLVGALYGGLASLVLMPSDRPMIGASGGAIALVGFLLVYGLRNRGRLPRSFVRSLVIGLILTAFIGAVGYQFVGNAAHLGGLLVGAALGWLMIPEGTTIPTSRAVVAAGSVSSAVLCVSAVGAIVVILRSAFA